MEEQGMGGAGTEGAGDDEQHRTASRRRLGSVADVAHAALFFASTEAGCITGQSLVIDGGQILPEMLTGLAADAT